jgi:hypothetical protein
VTTTVPTSRQRKRCDLARLSEIAGKTQDGQLDPAGQRRIQDVRQLMIVLRLCIECDVELILWMTSGRRYPPMPIKRYETAPGVLFTCL